MEAKLPTSLSFEGNVGNNWKKFKQQFEIYLLASDKQDKTSEVKVAILLNLIGEEGVEVFNNFKLSEKEKKNYGRVMEEFEKYLIPSINVVYERFVFYKREQGEGESVDHFVQDLSKLVKTCEFGEQSENMIRDRIVLGINDLSVQEKLLNVKQLTLKTAVEIAKNSEMMRQQLKEVQQQERNINVIKQRDREERNGSRESWKKNETEFLCSRCKLKHKPRSCPAYGKECKRCGKLNHFARGCTKKSVNEVKEEEIQSEGDSELFVGSIKVIKNQIDIVNKAWYEVIKVNDMNIKFKIDTGAEVNVLPMYIASKLVSRKDLKNTGIILECYGGFKVKPVGITKLKCTYKNCEHKLEFIIANVDSKPLLSYEACQQLGLLKNVNEIKGVDSLELLKGYDDVFRGLGAFPDKLTISLKSGAIPIANPPRRVPLTIKSKLETKLKQLEMNGVIKRVNEPSDWVSNIVIVEKPDKSLRVCLDPQNLNKFIKRDYYLIPEVNEMFAKLSGKECFTVLDLKDGFYQIKLDEDASKLCTFSTPFGCFRFLRLPFGLNVAPEYFQKMNIKNFSDIQGVNVYFDDLIIGGKTEEEHDRILRQVLQRARELNIKFNKKKTQLKVKEVKYLGHIFSKEGVRPDPDRIRAVEKMETPKSKKELQRVLGLVNYFRAFIPDLSSLTTNLRELLKERNEFAWMNVHSVEFEIIKKKIINSPVLASFDETKNIIIQSDASQGGLGCCLMQDNKPVYFASRSLTAAEKNYAQIEKELLAITFACKKFHNFIYGRKVKIITDHKPLLAILTKNVADIASTRLRRLKLKLLNYEIDLEFVPGKLMFVADTLSRAFIMDPVEDDKTMLEVVHCVSQCVMSDKATQEFTRETENDQELQLLKEYYFRGGEKIKPLKNYESIKNEINYADGLLYYQNKLIVPENLREKMCKLLHEGHFGVNKTLAKARELYFWPTMTKDVKEMIASCRICEKYRPANYREPMIGHQIPDLPYQKIAADIFTFAGKDYVAIIDYFSKWLDVELLQNKTSTEIIKIFKKIFAVHGMPQTVIADNMPFASYEMKEFAKKWGFSVTTSSPLYPKSNGMAESAVKIGKMLLRKNEDLQLGLLNYRNLPIEGIGISPAEILFNRNVKSKLPISTNLLRPKEPSYSEIKNNLQKKQWLQKQYYDRKAQERDGFEDGENVTIRKGKTWEPGRVLSKCKTPRSYIVKDNDNNIYRRNSSFLRKSKNETQFMASDKSGDTELGIEYNQSNTVMEPDGNSLNDTNDSKSYRANSKRPIKLPSRFNGYILDM